MANYLKYSTSTQSQALKVGNYWIGTGEIKKGPTSVTNYWNGIAPPSGGYTIYGNKASQGPSIYVVANDSELINTTNLLSGQNFTSVTQSLSWYNTQSDKMVFNKEYEPIVTSGLVLNSDAGFAPSYPRTGTTWYDLSGRGINGTLTNGPSYSSTAGGAILLDGIDDVIFYGQRPIDFNPSIQPFSMGGWINLLSTAGSGDRAVLLDIGGSASARLYIAIDKTNLRLVVDIRPHAGTTSVPVFGNTNSISLGVWVYAVATFDGGTIKLYQNGELISTATSFTNYPNGLGNWYSGHQDDDNHYMYGYISSVSLYLKTLSAQEVLQNYNAQKGRFI